MKLLSFLADPALRRENAVLREKIGLLNDFDQTQSKRLLVRIGELEAERTELRAERDALRKSVGRAPARLFY